MSNEKCKEYTFKQFMRDTCIKIKELHLDYSTRGIMEFMLISLLLGPLLTVAVHPVFFLLFPFGIYRMFYWFEKENKEDC